MRSSSLACLGLAALLVAVAGCSGNKGKIEDTNWVSQAGTFEGAELPPAARGLHFGKDGQLVYSIMGKPYKGSYALGMGPAVTFTFEEECDGRKIHAEKIVIDDDRLTLTSADGSTLTFQQIK
jgi:hypothetical protein